jgi:hypothetical protein
MLDDEGVDTTLVTRVDLPTTLAFVCVDDCSAPQYAFYTQNAADRSLRAEQVPSLPDSTRAAHLRSDRLSACSAGPWRRGPHTSTPTAPHLHRDWRHLIETGPPHLHRDWAHLLRWN